MLAMIQEWGNLPEMAAAIFTSPVVLITLFLGVALGYIIGVIPGLGATMGMAVLQFCQNLGQAVGSPLFGAVLDSMHGDWFMASVSVQVPILIIGIIFAVLVKPFPTDKAK